MSLEERLNVMGIDAATGESNASASPPYTNGHDSASATAPVTTMNGDGSAAATAANKPLSQIPKTDNLHVLLVQGLQSGDAKMLNVT